MCSSSTPVRNNQATMACAAKTKWSEVIIRNADSSISESSSSGGYELTRSSRVSTRSQSSARRNRVHKRHRLATPTIRPAPYTPIADLLEAMRNDANQLEFFRPEAKHLDALMDENLQRLKENLENDDLQYHFRAEQSIVEWEVSEVLEGELLAANFEHCMGMRDWLNE